MSNIYPGVPSLHGTRPKKELKGCKESHESVVKNMIQPIQDFFLVLGKMTLYEHAKVLESSSESDIWN